MADMPRLSSTGQLRTAHAFEQGKVLHVARAHLQHVGVLFHQIAVFRVDGFRDDQQAELAPDFRQDFQAFFSHALKTVGGGSRLERSAAKEARPGFADLRGRGPCLLAALNGTGPQSIRN